MKNKIVYNLLFVFFLQMTSLNGDEPSAIVECCSKVLSISVEKISIERFNGGVSNRVYLLSTTNGPKVVAKVFTKRSLEEVHRIDQITSDLRQIGFQIPETIAIELLQEKFPLHISKFQEGIYATDQELPQIAAIMAKLHLEGSQIAHLPLEKYKDKNHYKNLFTKCESWSYTEELKQIYEELDLSYLDDIPRGTIHGDFSYTNLINSQKGLTLIDFDHVCTSYLLTDLVRCHMFYGFDDIGSLQEQKVKDFTCIYDAVRNLTDTEKKNFYSHMKLMMIDTVLEMYYHMNIICDLPKSVIACEENKTLTPELLVKKIQNLRWKKNIYLDHEILPKPPFIFFGMSGAGKTTMIRGLMSLHPELFYIPIFTCTRNPRPDDFVDQFEYISTKEFLDLEKKENFLFTMHEGERYYGYRKTNLLDSDKYALLNCSPYGLDNAKVVQGIFVLIQGDTEKGLTIRGNAEDLEKRAVINQKVYKEFYSKAWFLNEMDIIHSNEWSKQDDSIQDLAKKILDKIVEFEDEPTLYEAA
jgi:Ser/Thr protein kinase RdoA (MazF antagonist)/guanylate kinase